MKRHFFLPLLILVLTTLTTLAQVQTTTEVRGLVQDATGGVIPGVSVSIRNQETGITRETVTNDEGFYVFQSMRPGTYTITASLAGFKTAVITDREVLVAIPAQVNITLEVGEVSDEVTVSAAGQELINTTTAELSTTIDQNLVNELPVETRNFFDLIALAPNTSPQYLSTTNLSFGQHSLRRVNAAGSFESSGVFAAGANDSASNVSIDGANQQIALYNQTVNIQSSSTIKELRIQTASANAEFGYGSNAINVITKGGTNEFHGEVFWQHRNDALDANGFFTNLAGNVLPEYKRNKFGATLGGPVITDRLHFFGNYEGSRLRQAVQGNARVPTAEIRNGDFSQYRPLAPGGGLAPVPVIYNPFDFDPDTGLRTPFPGNQIPPNLLDPGAQALLAYTPLPNVVIDEVPQFSGLDRTEMDENQYSVRIDWETSSTSNIWGRYTFAERDAFNTSLIPPLEGERTPSSTHTTVVNWTKILTPSIINDLSVSHSRPKWGIGRPLNVPDVAREMGLENTSGLTGSPAIIQPDFRLGDSGLFVWDPTQDTYQIKDDVSFTRGTHGFKAGIHVTERRLYFLQQSFDKGLFRFDPIFSAACPLGNEECDAAREAAGLPAGGVGFADFLMGTPFSTQLELREVIWRGYQRYYGAYFQDTWQIHPRLTLNLGLRYEHWRPWFLPRHSAVQYDFTGDGGLKFALQNPFDALDPATDYGRDAPLNPDVPKQGYLSSTLDFAPRIGFAFTLTPETTIRAAGGIFYAGNVNTNQFSDAQSGGAPFVTRDTRQIARTEQLPPIFVRDLFPQPVSSIPQPGEDPPASPRALGNLVDGNKIRYPAPTVYQWSFSIQHRFNPSWSLHLDYLGSHTIHNQQFVDLNAPALPQGPLADLSIQERRRFPLWGPWLTWVNWGYQSYNSGTFGVRNREWNGLSFMANFMWAKNTGSSLSPIANDRNNFDFRNWDIWRGRARITPTARFVSGWSYRLPWGRSRTFDLDGLTNVLLGGWVLSGITEFSTGAPATVSAADNSGTGLGQQLADRIPGCDLGDAPGDRFEWFNIDCFEEPEFGTWGKSSIGLFDDPGINNWNVNISKTFEMQENHRVEFRMETFNLFNHTQWGPAVTSLVSPSFGRVSGTRPARQIQFSLFYNF